MSTQGKVSLHILDRSCWLCVDLGGDGGQIVSGTPNVLEPGVLNFWPWAATG